MKKPVKFLSVIAVASAMLFTACNRNDPQPGITSDTGQYLITAFSDETFANTYYQTLPDIRPGTNISIVNATEVPESYVLTQLSGYGFVFVHQRKSQKLIKYGIENGRLVEKGEMVTPNFGDVSFMSSISWIEPGKKFFVSNALYDNFLQGAIIDVESMTFDANLNIEADVASGRSLFPGFSFYKDGTIYLSYINVDNGSYAADSMRFVLLDSRTLAIKGYIADSRSVSPGITFLKSSFTDENGDLYFVTTPSNYWALRPELPSAVYRIKRGEQRIDPEFEMNLTELCENGRHACGNLYYQGNGRFLFRMFDERLIIEYSDYEGYNTNNVFPVETWSGNFNNKTVAKVNIPNTRLGTQDFIKYENDRVLIPINSTEGSFIYQINSDLISSEKMLTYAGASRVREFYKF